MKFSVPCLVFTVMVGCVAINAQQGTAIVPPGTSAGTGGVDSKGYTIPAESLSPDGRYGVTVPDSIADQADPERRPHHDLTGRAPKSAVVSEEEAKATNNCVVDLRTGRVLAKIRTKFVGESPSNHGGVVPARWSRDGSLLLWHVAGKWSPDALTLVKIDKGRVVWQTDVLKAAEKEILKATRAARPADYAAARKWNEGNGAAYPDGFTVEVSAEDGSLRLPLWISASLTANPKEIEGGPQLESHLLGKVHEDGRFEVESFGFDVPNSPHFMNGKASH